MLPLLRSATAASLLPGGSFKAFTATSAPCHVPLQAMQRYQKKQVEEV
jgi:hypothetical protein